MKVAGSSLVRPLRVGVIPLCSWARLLAGYCRLLLCLHLAPKQGCWAPVKLPLLHWAELHSI